MLDLVDTDRVMLLYGTRRMEALAASLAKVAPQISFEIATTPTEAEHHLHRAEIMVTTQRVPSSAITAPKLAWLHLYPTGIDHVAIPELRSAPFAITYKEWASVVPMAEHAMALLLAITRQLHQFRDFQAKAEWRPFSAPPASEMGQLAGKTLGIIGLGHVGSALARRASAFDLRVVGTKRNASPIAHVAEVLPAAEIHNVLSGADFVVLATPLGDATFHFFGAAEIEAMKPSAWLINVSRGPVIDEQALVAALQAGRIAGAALDVFETEPLPPSSVLWSLPNVIVTPHVAGSGPDNEADATREISDNLVRYLQGETLSGLVNRADIPLRRDLPTH